MIYAILYCSLIIMGDDGTGMADTNTIGERKMPGWLVILLFFAAYLILMRWVLPKLGVQT